MKNILRMLTSFALLLGLSVGMLSFVAQPAYAADTCSGSTKECASKGVNQIDNGTTGADLAKFIKNLVDLLLFVIGAVSVVMIIIGGLRYTISNGDQSQVKAAKDTIMYSIVGLVVAMMSYAIVNFVIKQL